MPIPMKLDTVMMVADLNRWGLRDFKITTICNFDRAYIAKLRAGKIKTPSYDLGAQLYNLWEQEAIARLAHAGVVADTQTLVATLPYA